MAHDDGEISFYEELGVSSDASPQEIREAFHAYARLLHPDQQSDPVLRDLAEKQMRKLNRVYAVLSDPERRREYDEIMGEPSTALIVDDGAMVSRFRWFAPKLPWVAAIVLSVGILLWLAYDATPGSQNRGFEANNVPAAVPAASSASTATATVRRTPNQNSDAAQIASLKSELKAALEQRDAAVTELSKLRSAAEAETQTASNAAGNLPAPKATASAPAAAPVTITELPSAAKTPAAANSAPPRPEHTADRKLAGFWFYAAPPDGQKNKNKSLYLPEFIEATITEDGGTIRGRYRSRFIIGDRAISPDVNFTFTGSVTGTQCSCTWAGAGGSRGDLTLKLTGENSLKVDWIAREMGNLGLGSGTAILTRKIE